jgi:molybdopterin molybdotransferase
VVTVPVARDEALRLVLASATPLPAREVLLDEALGLVAAGDIAASDPIPPFTNSGMDGFALRAVDVAGASDETPVRLAVIEDLPAGRVAVRAVGPGTALRIMTGASLPAGADAVVPVESTEMAGDGVAVRRAVPVGANVRPAGEDVAAGARVLARGTVIGPGDLGLLAQAGRATVPVHPRPRVAIVTTGDELVEAGQPLAPGLIRDANVHVLRAQVLAAGGEPLTIARVPDTREAIAAALRSALAAADVVVTTGGVSMGEYDHVKDALERMGAERAFWRVAQKPAGPLGLWRLEGRPVFGAPGNPVAAMLVTEEYVRPLLRRLLGHAHLFRPERVARLEGGWRRKAGDERLHWLRLRLEERDGALRARPAGPQGSGVLGSMARADALGLVPSGVAEIADGGEVLVHLVRELEDH